MIQVFKYRNGLSPDIMNAFSKPRQNTYNLKNFQIFEFQNPKTEMFDLDNIAYRASQLWKNVHEEGGFSISLPVFKESIEKIRFIFFWCNSCKINIHHLGYTLCSYI